MQHQGKTHSWSSRSSRKMQSLRWYGSPVCHGWPSHADKILPLHKLATSTETAPNSAETEESRRWLLQSSLPDPQPDLHTSQKTISTCFNTRNKWLVILGSLFNVYQRPHRSLTMVCTHQRHKKIHLAERTGRLSQGEPGWCLWGEPPLLKMLQILFTTLKAPVSCWRFLMKSAMWFCFPSRYTPCVQAMTGGGAST